MLPSLRTGKLVVARRTQCWWWQWHMMWQCRGAEAHLWYVVCPRLRMGPPDPTSRRPALVLDGPSRGIIPRMMEELFARLSIMDTVDVRGVWAACPGFHTCNHACEVARWRLMCVASMWKSTWRSFETCSCHRKKTSGSAATCSRVARSSQMRPRCVPKQCRPTSRAPLPLMAVNAGPGGERG